MGFLKAGTKLEPKRRTADLDIAELGYTVRIVELSGADTLELNDIRSKAKASIDANVFLVRNAVVDDEMKPAFANDQAARDFLKAISLETLSKISKQVSEWLPKPQKTEGEDPGKSPGTQSSTGESA